MILQSISRAQNFIFFKHISSFYLKQIKFQTLAATNLSITSIGLKRIVKISPGSTFFGKLPFFKQRCKNSLPREGETQEKGRESLKGNGKEKGREGES